MKSDDQFKILESEFQKDSKWSKEKMKRLASLLNLKESQIYKWNWDRRQMQDRYLQKRILGGDIFIYGTLCDPKYNMYVYVLLGFFSPPGSTCI